MQSWIARATSRVALVLVAAALFGGCAHDEEPARPIRGLENAEIEANYPGRPEERVYSEDLQPPSLDDKMSTELMANTVDLSSAGKRVDALKFDQLPEYQLGPGDVIEVIYQIRNLKREQEYRLEVSDQLDLSFLYTPEYNRKIVVRTDGKAEFPLLGTLDVAGKQASDIQTELTEAYSQYMKDPSVQLVVVSSNSAIEELKRAITTSPRGQSRLEPVRPDGFVSLPLVGDVGMSGLTVSQATEAVITKYRDVGVQDIDVTVVLLEVKAPTVYVMGEVEQPGSIVLERPSGVFRTIGRAGGFTREADPANIVLVRSTEEREERYLLNFFQWRDGKGEINVPVKSGDIVYVPKQTSNFVYVLGEVKSPGSVKLEAEQKLTVTQALASSGGLLPSAYRRQILVLRKSPKNDPIIIATDMKKLFSLKQYDDEDDLPPSDPVLQPGDIVFAPNSKIGNVNDFAQVYFRDGLWTILPFNVTATYAINK